MSTHLHLVRVTLEAESPLSIGTGGDVTRRRPARDPADPQKSEDHAAAALARDANGHPTLPGPSVQGVLRRLARVTRGDRWAEEVFGRQGPRHIDGSAGTVTVGWGLVHGADDAAVDPRPGRATADDVLRLLKSPAPLWRDHVALSHRLSVEGRKKFARAAVPRGTRFSLELACFAPADDETLIKVAALFRHPAFRLGAARNRGYGRVRLVRASHVALPLTDPATIRERRAEPPSTPLPTDLTQAAAFVAPRGTATLARLTLTAEGLIRFGAATEEAVAFTGGTHGMRRVNDGAAPRFNGWSDDPSATDRSNILRLLTEPVIRWTGDTADIRKPADTLAHPPGLATLGFPVPGSQLRGPLAHRALYHWNRAKGRTVDADAFAQADSAAQERMLADLAGKATRPPELGLLFGAAKGPPVAGRGPSPGQAGRLMVDDARIETSWIVALDHISLDRFAGGVRNIEGVLFAEEALFGAMIVADLRIERGPVGPVGGWPEDTAHALLLALRDLCTARLPLGARNLGACRGTIAWSGADAASWARAWEKIQPTAPAGGRR
jgi:CRISPR/Cas system CSM-associated protein Csm3 (group 7 of RAMP superfamily)